MQYAAILNRLGLRLFRIAIRPLLTTLILLIVIYLILVGTKALLTHPKELPYIQSFGQIVQSIVTVLAILVGGVWAYYRFAKGRTFVKRVEPKLATTPLSTESGFVLIVDAAIRNIGNVTVPLSAAYVIFSNSDPNQPRGPRWSDIDEANKVDVLTYLGRQRVRYYLEPGEEMHRIVTLSVPTKSNETIRLDFIVESHAERCWSVTAVVQNPSFPTVNRDTAITETVPAKKYSETSSANSAENSR
jgi:hypothetical protein